MDNQVDVLVVGAGPVGLFCANELSRHGLTFKIIEKKTTLSDKSKALGLHIRTLDVFKDCGLLDSVLSLGHKVNGVTLKSNYQTLAHLDFNGINANRHYLIDLPQDKTERVLYDHLKETGADVEWEHELVSFEQNENGVTSIVKSSDGTLETIKTTWLIACDGAYSTVRHLCNLNFDGAEYHQNWWLADLLIDWNQPEDRMMVYPSYHGPLACFPMGNKRYRLVLTAPDKDEKEPQLKDIQQAFSEHSCDEATLTDPIWITKFYIHHRQVNAYKVGLVFLGGDAAHIHSPLGGQGLNTGIQDMYNLVWKLALVKKGLAKKALLDSYHLERYPVGRQVLNDTDKMTRMILIKNKGLIFLRNTMMSFIMSIKSIRNKVASRVAELTISYANSPAVLDLSHNPHIKAGNYLVDFDLVNMTSNAPQPLSTIISGTNHHAFIFQGEEQNNAHLIKLADNLVHDYGKLMNVHIVGKHPIDSIPDRVNGWLDDSGVHDLLHIKQPTLILFRPDKYIGLSLSPILPEELKAYLDLFFIK